VSQVRSVGEMEILDRADFHFTSNRFNEAITEYKRFSYLYPDSRYRDYSSGRIGLSYQALGDSVLADRYVRQSIELTRDDDVRDSRRLALALLQVEDGRYLTALAQFDSIASPGSRVLFCHGLLQLCLLDSIGCIVSIDALRDIEDEIASDYRDTLLALLMEMHSMPLRSPRKARVLSSIFPGAGQIYGGDPGDGVNAFLVNGAIGYLVVRNISNEQYGGAVAAALLFQSFYRRNTLNARRITRQYNEGLIEEYVSRVLSKLIDAFDYRLAWQREHGCSTIPDYD